MRVSDGARKVNRHGGAIFIHDDWREDRPIDFRVFTAIPQAPIAPVEIRDFIYGRLIKHSPATLYPDAVIAGEKGLLARGWRNHLKKLSRLGAANSRRRLSRSVRFRRKVCVKRELSYIRKVFLMPGCLMRCSARNRKR